MKLQTRTTRYTLAALAAAAALAITPTLAQPGHGRGRGPGPGGGPMFGRLLERLDLTDDQKTSIHETMRSFDEESRKLRDKRFDAQRAVGEAIHADVFDEGAIRAAAADLAAVDADLAVMRGRMFQEINKVLTQEQRDKLRELIADWHAMADDFHGRHGRRGPGPGAPPDGGPGPRE